MHDERDALHRRTGGRRQMKVGFGALVEEICLKWGFCGCLKDDQAIHVSLIIPSTGPISADQFVEWVFLANDLNPNSEPARWRREKEAIRAAFVKHMGAEIVDAPLLSWKRDEQGEREWEKTTQGQRQSAFNSP
jgi:hypothetical protein